MDSPLRVLHVVVNMNRGGAETLIMNLYRNMDREKIQFDFLTCKSGTFDDEIMELGGKIHQIPYVTEVGHRNYLKKLRQFFQENPTYKIVHSHMDKMSGFILKAAKRENVPIRIAHSHNTESEGSLPVKAYKWYAGCHINSSATHHYACSHYASKWLFGAKSSEAFILKNGIQLDTFQFNPEVRYAVREKLQIKESALVLGHVGRFNQQKNHLFLLDIFYGVNKAWPNSILILVGDGPLDSEIMEKITALNLENKVYMLGVREDIHHLLNAFDIFVFPSRHEGLPVTLVEAQGAGLPCVISNKITNEVDMGIGLVDYLPITLTRTWVQHIIKLAMDKRVRKTRQKALAQKGYDIKSTAQQMESAYLSLGARVG